MKRDPLLIVAILAVVGLLALQFINALRQKERIDQADETRDSLRIEGQLKARLAQEKEKWADSLDQYANDVEARALPPETLYLHHHEASLTADTSVMYHYMGQMPRDTPITH